MPGPTRLEVLPLPTCVPVWLVPVHQVTVPPATPLAVNVWVALAQIGEVPLILLMAGIAVALTVMLGYAGGVEVLVTSE